eukprot:s2263_g12.t1
MFPGVVEEVDLLIFRSERRSSRRVSQGAMEEQQEKNPSAEVEVPDTPPSPIRAARKEGPQGCEEGHLKIVRFLAEVGAAKDQAAKDGVQPQYGQLAGAAKDRAANDGSTPLIVAVGEGHLEIVRFLAEVGAAKDQAANDGREEPLIVAARTGHIEVAQQDSDASQKPPSRASGAGSEERAPSDAPPEVEEASDSEVFGSWCLFFLEVDVTHEFNHNNTVFHPRCWYFVTICHL